VRRHEDEYSHSFLLKGSIRLRVLIQTFVDIIEPEKPSWTSHNHIILLAVDFTAMIPIDSFRSSLHEDAIETR